MGCRTTKTSIKDRAELNRKTELSGLALRAEVKKRNVLTYWPNGSVYQFEQLREQVDQAKSARLNVEETKVLKRDETVKQRERFWLYGGIAVAMVILFWIYQLIKN